MKHFTATTYIFDKKFERTLFIFHKKLNTWLPPGGHLEDDESPEEAALREIREETGLQDIEFIPLTSPPEGDDRARFLLLPHHLLLEEIEEDHHHMDFIFYAVCGDGCEVNSVEDLEFRWFTLDEIRGQSGLFSNVVAMAEYGFNLRTQWLNELKNEST